MYDRGRIAGERITLRKGEAGESYAGINKPPVNVGGRYVLADADGAFGSPTSDSQRTMITPACTACLMAIFAPTDYAADRLQRQTQLAAERIVQVCGGEAERVEVLG